MSTTVAPLCTDSLDGHVNVVEDGKFEVLMLGVLICHTVHAEFHVKKEMNVALQCCIL
jgi:hypothetical protein